MTQQRKDTRGRVFRIALSGLLTALMLVMGYIESLLPSVGVPGIRLGLSNGVLIFALYMLDVPTAYILMAVKVALSGLLFSGVTAMPYAFAGGLASLTVMALMSRRSRLSPVLVSAAGGLTHNVGQVAMALLITPLPMQVYLYLALLAAAGIACGLLTGVCAAAVIRHLAQGGFRMPESGRSGRVLILLAACVTAAMGIWAFGTAGKPAGTLVEPAPAPGGIRMMTTDELRERMP